jgi:purine-cytosine permease-like protein
MLTIDFHSEVHVGHLFLHVLSIIIIIFGLFNVYKIYKYICLTFTVCFIYLLLLLLNPFIDSLKLIE